MQQINNTSHFTSLSHQKIPSGGSAKNWRKPVWGPSTNEAGDEVRGNGVLSAVGYRQVLLNCVTLRKVSD